MVCRRERPEPLRPVNQGREGFRLAQLGNAYALLCKGELNMTLTVV